MRVRDVKAVDSGRIIRDLILSYRVGNLLACGVLRKICERILPLVLLSDCLGIYFLAICQQTNRDAARSLAVLVVAVVPRLRAGDGCRLGLMRVLDVVAVNRCRVAVNRILGHRVGDFLAACILRKIRERILPLVLLSDGLGIYFLAICQQTNRDALRSLAVLVVAVVPRLRAADCFCSNTILDIQIKPVSTIFCNSAWNIANERNNQVRRYLEVNRSAQNRISVRRRNLLEVIIMGCLTICAVRR